MADSVADRVRKATSQMLKVEESRINEDSDFVKDLGADSLKSVELVAAFEEEFDIEMDEEAALNVKTVGKAIEHIAKAMEEQGKGGADPHEFRRGARVAEGGGLENRLAGNRHGGSNPSLSARGWMTGYGSGFFS